MYYLALVLEAEDGLDFVCPDIPGFTAHADSREFGEAVAVAREVLAGHLAALIDAGGTLPRARGLDELRAHPEFAEDFAEAATTTLLPAVVPAGRSVRVNLSLDENTLQLIDASARDRGLTRSAFVAEACRRFVTGADAMSTTAPASAAAFDAFFSDLRERLRGIGADETLSGGVGQAVTDYYLRTCIAEATALAGPMPGAEDFVLSTKSGITIHGAIMAAGNVPPPLRFSRAGFTEGVMSFAEAKHEAAAGGRRGKKR